jgi:hypothetical protein
MKKLFLSILFSAIAFLAISQSNTVTSKPASSSKTEQNTPNGEFEKNDSRKSGSTKEKGKEIKTVATSKNRGNISRPGGAGRPVGAGRPAGAGRPSGVRRPGGTGR